MFNVMCCSLIVCRLVSRLMGVLLLVISFCYSVMFMVDLLCLCQCKKMVFVLVVCWVSLMGRRWKGCLYVCFSICCCVRVINLLCMVKYWLVQVLKFFLFLKGFKRFFREVVCFSCMKVFCCRFWKQWVGWFRLFMWVCFCWLMFWVVLWWWFCCWVEVLWQDCCCVVVGYGV